MSTKYWGKMRVSSCNCITVKVYFYEKQLILSYYFSTVLEGMSLAFLAELSPEESAPLFLGCANRKRELLGPAPALLSGVRGASQERGAECPSPGSGPVAAQRPAATRLQSARGAPLAPRGARPGRELQGRAPTRDPPELGARPRAPLRPRESCAPGGRAGGCRPALGVSKAGLGGAGVELAARWGSGLLPPEGGQRGARGRPGGGGGGGGRGRRKTKGCAALNSKICF